LLLDLHPARSPLVAATILWRLRRPAVDVRSADAPMPAGSPSGPVSGMSGRQRTSTCCSRQLSSTGDRRVRCRCGKGVQLACRCGVPAQRGRHLRRQRRRDPNRFHPGWRTDGAGTVLSGARPRALRRIADGPIDDPERAPPLPGPARGDQCPASAAALPVCRARGDPDLGQSLP